MQAGSNKSRTWNVGTWKQPGHLNIYRTASPYMLTLRPRHSSDNNYTLQFQSRTMHFNASPIDAWTKSVPVMWVGDMSIYSAFMQAYRYDSMLTVIESIFF